MFCVNDRRDTGGERPGESGGTVRIRAPIMMNALPEENGGVRGNNGTDTIRGVAEDPFT